MATTTITTTSPQVLHLILRPAITVAAPLTEAAVAETAAAGVLLEEGALVASAEVAGTIAGVELAMGPVGWVALGATLIGGTAYAVYHYTQTGWDDNEDHPTVDLVQHLQQHQNHEDEMEIHDVQVVEDGIATAPEPIIFDGQSIEYAGLVDTASARHFLQWLMANYLEELREGGFNFIKITKGHRPTIRLECNYILRCPLGTFRICINIHNFPISGSKFGSLYLKSMGQAPLIPDNDLNPNIWSANLDDEQREDLLNDLRNAATNGGAEDEWYQHNFEGAEDSFEEED